jgi:hypothetical protein
LFALGRYVGGAVTAGMAVLVHGLWVFAKDRGDDDRQALW